MSNAPLIFFVLVLFALGGFYLSTCRSDSCLIFTWQKIIAVDNFERCEKLGFPVAESYPRQCRAGDKLFVESVPAGKPNKIRIASPLPNSRIESPVMVSGEARGLWDFEASFPVGLFDANGKLLNMVPAQAQGEWMTTEFVPFSVTLTFKEPETATGTLVLYKDNPSGLPENDDLISIPVRF